MESRTSNGAVVATIQLTIETEDGDKIAVKVSSDCTVKTIKETITEKTATPMIRQRLYVVGKRVDDGSYLYKTEMKHDGVKAAAYGVKGGSSLLLRIMIPIEIQTLKGGIIQVEAEKFDTIQRLKNTVHELVGIAPAKLHLVLPSKELLEGLPLFSVHLENKRSISGYGIQPGTKLHLAMEIFVRTLTEKMISLKVHPSDEIWKIKEEIHDQLKNVPEQSYLICYSCMGIGIENLHGLNATLADCKIEEGSVLDMFIRILVHISPPSGLDYCFVTVKLTDTVEKIKSSIPISEKDDNNEAEAGRRTRLVHNGKELEDHCTIAEYGILSNSNMTLQYLMRIDIHGGTQKLLSLFIHESDTIKEVKRRILRVIDIPIIEQRLIKDGRSLDDNKTVGNYRIKEGSSLICHREMRGC